MKLQKEGPPPKDELDTLPDVFGTTDSANFMALPNNSDSNDRYYDDTYNTIDLPTHTMIIEE